MRLYVAFGLELVALAFIPVACLGAIFLVDGDALLSREAWAWYALNAAFLLVPKALWWTIGRIFMSRAARLGGLLVADTLAVTLTLLALTLPGEAGWLWYVMLVVPGMVVGSVLASSALAMAPQREARMGAPLRATVAMVVGCALMLVTLLVLATSPRPWRRISLPVDLKVAESRSRQIRYPRSHGVPSPIRCGTPPPV